MKITPLQKVGGPNGAPMQRTFNTQQSPSMQAKLRAAAAAAAAPVPGGQRQDAGVPSFEQAQRQAQGQPIARQLGIQPPATAATPAPAQNANPATGEGAIPPGEATTRALNPQLAAMARHQRQLRKAQVELEVQKQAFQQERQNYVSKEELRANALKVLSEVGIPYDKLVEEQLTQTPTDPVQALKAEIAELKQQIQGTSKTWQESQTQRDLDARKQAVRQIDKDAELLVNSDPAYETIRTTKQHSEVTKLIENVFDEEGVMLSVEDACRQVEDELLEMKVQEIKSLSQLAKVKAKLEPQELAAGNTGTPAPAPKQGSRQPPQVRTLTNAHSVQRPLSARERGIQAFERARLGQS